MYEALCQIKLPLEFTARYTCRKTVTSKLTVGSGTNDYECAFCVLLILFIFNFQSQGSWPSVWWNEGEVCDYFMAIPVKDKNVY